MQILERLGHCDTTAAKKVDVDDETMYVGKLYINMVKRINQHKKICTWVRWDDGYIVHGLFS